ncbi:hypothetical protein QBC43DRAFT_337428 [Cladorrhinum sp. PSN259]|nr:hypothetical protein QBC43DRAFT_337428 [Cladorrhinum sp. PSN259]
MSIPDYNNTPPWNSPNTRGLTIGVELELFLAQHPSPESESNGNENNDKVIKHWVRQPVILAEVARYLRQVVPLEFEIRAIRADPKDKDAKESHSFHGYYACVFEVKGESTLSYKKAESTLDHRYAWVPIEVTTPALPLEGIPPAVQLIFDGAIKRYYLPGINSTANLHVHVGKGDAGFSELTIKKLATILWLGEKRFDRLYAVEPHTLDNPWARPFSATNIGSLGAFDRVDPACPVGVSDIWRRWMKAPVEYAVLECHGVSGTHALHQMEDRFLLFSVDTRLKYLWDAQGLDRLCDLLVRVPDSESKGEFTASYNFLNLARNRVSTVKSGFDELKRTIEFRKPAATLRHEVAMAWCHLSAEVVGFAERSNHLAFGDIVRKLFRVESEYTMDEMLKDIGCDPAQVELLKNRPAETEALFGSHCG